MGTAAAAILAYSVRLETRVTSLETRGAEYTVARMDRDRNERITVIEQQARQERAQIERMRGFLTIDDIMEDTEMRGERLKEIIGELRDLVEQAQASLNDRPVLQRLLTALKEKIAEAAGRGRAVGPGAAGRTSSREGRSPRRAGSDRDRGDLRGGAVYFRQDGGRNRASLTVPLYPILAAARSPPGGSFLLLVQG